MREKYGWLLRHYGVQRLLAIALAWPLYHVAWFFLQLSGYGQEGALLPPVERLARGTHDVWLGYWVACVSVPLLWLASYKLPIVEVKWAFRLLVFIWLFDGVVAIAEGFSRMRGMDVHSVALVLQAWGGGVLLPIAIGFLPWGLLELWETVSGLPLLKRWRFSGIEEHAEWISSRKLRKHTQPLPGRIL